jgi:hypothetical protein
MQRYPHSQAPNAWRAKCDNYDNFMQQYTESSEDTSTDQQDHTIFYIECAVIVVVIIGIGFITYVGFPWSQVNSTKRK